EYLCFVDDDCDPDPGWVDALVRAQGNHSMRLVGGKVVNGLPRNPYSSASQSLCSFLTEYYAAGTSEMTFFTTNNMCCRAEDFRTLAGFDPGFRIASEDRDFSLRWKEAGGQLVHAPEAVVHHSHVLSFASFWRQHQNYGLGARQLHLAMDRRRDRRPKIEPARFYFGLLFHPLRHAGHRRLYQSFLIGLSQVAMVSGYYRQVMKERRERGTGR
ncbi:MAG: glycosyltransferase family 2 protein, partial [Roseivivax sp.]|nr:glycosyltransferase family 2 protein [Roseivivax sp.]